MKLIEWNNKLKLGVNIIDGHHLQLVSLINETYNAIQMNDKHKLNNVLDDIVYFTAHHFITEKSLVNKYNYSLKDEHERTLSAFHSKIRELQSKLNTDEVIYNIQIVAFLKDWLMDHILVTDREFAGFLISRGIT